MPGMSFSSCSDSSDTARSMLSGRAGHAPGAADDAGFGAEERRVRLDADHVRRLAARRARHRAPPASRRTAPRLCRNSARRRDSRSARSSAARAIRKSAPGTARANARRLRSIRRSVSMIGCKMRWFRLSRCGGEIRRRDATGSAIVDGRTARGVARWPQLKEPRPDGARAAGAAAVSAGLRRLPPAGLAARRAVRRLLAEAAVPRKALVRGDGNAVLARHGRGLPFGRGDRQPAALRARAGGGRLFRRRAADGAGAEIQRPHRSCAVDGALDAAGRRRA